MLLKGDAAHCERRVVVLPTRPNTVRASEVIEKHVQSFVALLPENLLLYNCVLRASFHSVGCRSQYFGRFNLL